MTDATEASHEIRAVLGRFARSTREPESTTTTTPAAMTKDPAAGRGFSREAEANHDCQNINQTNHHYLHENE